MAVKIVSPLKSSVSTERGYMSGGMERAALLVLHVQTRSEEGRMVQGTRLDSQKWRKSCIDGS